MRDCGPLRDLDLQIRALGLPEPVREHQGIPGHRFRFDRAWPELRVALEYDGLQWAGGKSRHTSVLGFTRDCEKLNLAMLAGWRVLRVTAPHVASGQAIRWIEEALK